ncbi:MAG: hypothetical protein KDA85_20920, partial [Planctomycetaceae bacterium]|nr:hypothetical protein [Planctomycetaceae bacterium]
NLRTHQTVSFGSGNLCMNETLKKTFEVRIDRQVSQVRWSPAEPLMAASGLDGTVRWWLGADSEWMEQPALTCHHGWVSALALTSDGQRMLTADSWGALQCHQRTTSGWEPVWRVEQAHDGWIRGAVLSPQESILVTIGRDGTVRCWDVGTGMTLRHWSVPGVDLLALAVADDGTIVTGDHHGVVHCFSAEGIPLERPFDTAELFLEHRLQDVGGVRGIRFSPDGATLAIWGTRPKNGGNVQGVPLVMLFDWPTGNRRQLLEAGAVSDVYVTDVHFHPRGHLIITTSGNPGTGKLLCVRSGETEPFATEKGLANCHAVAVAADTGDLVVVSTNRNSNGNGRRLNDDGTYPGNYSLLTGFAFADVESQRNRCRSRCGVTGGLLSD